VKARKRHQTSDRLPASDDAVAGRAEGVAFGPGGFEPHFLHSVEQLRAAGVIESIEHNSATGQGVITFTPDAHDLMVTGRQIFREPGFLSAWLSGDPALVRRWLESEAALIRGLRASAPRDPDRPERDESRDDP
jgi:hypothetical protein